MNRSSVVVFGAAAMMIASACSGVDRPASQATTAPTPVPAPAAIDVALLRPSTARLSLEDPGEMATLRAIALNAAANAGVSSPARIHAVAHSDHQAAEFLLSGAIIDDHAPVYVLKISGGTFTANHHPPGRAAPQGAFLTLTIDATTHRVTDLGLVDNEPDLSKISSPAPVEL